MRFAKLEANPWEREVRIVGMGKMRGCDTGWRSSDLSYGDEDGGEMRWFCVKFGGHGFGVTKSVQNLYLLGWQGFKDKKWTLWPSAKASWMMVSRSFDNYNTYNEQEQGCHHHHLAIRASDRTSLRGFGCDTGNRTHVTPFKGSNTLHSYYYYFYYYYYSYYHCHDH